MHEQGVSDSYNLDEVGHHILVDEDNSKQNSDKQTSSRLRLNLGGEGSSQRMEKISKDNVQSVHSYLYNVSRPYGTDGGMAVRLKPHLSSSKSFSRRDSNFKESDKENLRKSRRPTF